MSSAILAQPDPPPLHFFPFHILTSSVAVERRMTSVYENGGEVGLAQSGCARLIKRYKNPLARALVEYILLKGTDTHSFQSKKRIKRTNRSSRRPFVVTFDAFGRVCGRTLTALFLRIVRHVNRCHLLQLGIEEAEGSSLLNLKRAASGACYISLLQKYSNRLTMPTHH